MLDLIYIPNNYIPADKQRHFISGFVGGSVLFICIGVYSVVTISVIAVGKEINDYFHKDVHTPDVWDWVATTLGSILGAILVNSITK